MKSLLTVEQKAATQVYYSVAMQMFNKMFEIGNAANDRSEAVRYSERLAENIAMTPEISRRTNNQALDLAMEVVEQWGYEPEPGVFTSGGLSTLESAFAILRENGMLDSKGRYCTKHKK